MLKVLANGIRWLAAACLVVSLAHAHGGGVDSLGCHHNRKTGGYHCHRGEHAGESFGSKDKMLRRSGGTGTTAARSTKRTGGIRTVVRVVDGDTLVLDGGERVRLIGVDTPETKHPTKPVERFGKKASAFTRRMVEGKRIRLEFDQGNAHLGHKDRYGRTLAYVLLEDGRHLNAEIIRQGYGFAYTRFPFERMEEFRRYQREAREEGRGLWGTE